MRSYAAFFSIQNLQSLPYVFGGYVHKYWQSQRRFCDRESALHQRGYIHPMPREPLRAFLRLCDGGV